MLSAAPPPPLAGLRVVEIANYMAGPFCGMQLADLGADVVKVEHPERGDLSRALEPIVDGESGNFARLNRGKRSLGLDLKQEEGRDAFRQLVASGADVVVENLRPGTMRDLGLDPAELLREHPRLVYCAVTGFGQDGPYADRPALDIIVQALSGLMSVTGEADRGPVKVGVSISDLVAGLYATIAVLAALAARDRDGRGQLLDVSMLESSVALSVWEAGQYFTTGEVARRSGSSHKLLAPYQAIEAADGHFIVGATTPPNWTAFCAALGLGHLERDERFADATLRRRNIESLLPLIEAVTRGATADHWLRVLHAAGVPCAPIRDHGEVFTDPHLAERGFFVDLPHARLGAVRGIGTPLRLARTPARLERAGPLLGQHSVEILREIGCSDERIASLRSRGVVR